MRVEISDSARKRIESMAAESAGLGVLRLGLSKSGCNGYAYKIELIGAPAPHEVEMESNGVRLAVNPQDFERLDGVRLDWVREGLSSRLAIINPNEKSSCGCGESIGF